jgi:hypothetical protein
MIEPTADRQEEHFKHVPDLHRLVKKFLRRKANLQVRGDRSCDMPHPDRAPLVVEN